MNVDSAEERLATALGVHDGVIPGDEQQKPNEGPSPPRKRGRRVQYTVLSTIRILSVRPTSGPFLAGILLKSPWKSSTVLIFTKNPRQK